MLYLENIGKKITKKKLSFHIEKNIPVEAGMAGGSADGAAALKLLNQAFGNPLSEKELCKLGASVGADVPFCLQRGLCRAEGVGEILTPLNPAPEIPLVMITPGGGLPPRRYSRNGTTAIP